MEVERVQSIAMTYEKKRIPTEFMQPEKTRADLAVVEVPSIDLGEPDEDRLVEVIAKASQEWGLFQVVNHGIPPAVIDRLQRAGKAFFELPQSEKEVYSVRPPDYAGLEGYANSLSSTPPSSPHSHAPSPSPSPSPRPWVDHLFHNIWPPSAVNYHFWPKNPPSYRSANEEYGVYLRGVTEKLMRCLSKGLEVEEERLKEAAGGEEMVYLAKINYYPPCPFPELALGVPPHTDLSLLTILVPNPIPGLQVCRDSVWYNVRYIPNALIIHIGDQLEILSNGKYKAVLHRTTVNKDHTRMSWPVFIEPPPHQVIGPLPELITQPNIINNNNPPAYKTKKYADYKYCKLNKLPQ